MKLLHARLALPLLSCTLLLTACPGNTTPPPPTPPVDEATLIAVIDRTPKPLPDLRPAGLGEAGTLGGPNLHPVYAGPGHLVGGAADPVLARAGLPVA